MSAALPQPGIRAWVGVLPVLAVAGALGAWAVPVNIQRGCQVNDTPYLGLCAEAPEDLRERVARNPGDTAAYVRLAHLDRSPQRPALVAAASALAPHHPQVRMAEAVLALEKEDWTASAAALVEVVEHYPTIVAPAQALARMVGGGQADLLAAAIRPGSRWFHRVMEQMPAAKVPLAAALPLIVRAHAVGVIDLKGARPYLQQLKAAGAWGDAYALWLALRGASASLLLNASFDQALEAEGFDWETPQPAGPRPAVVLAQPAVPRRGVVLELGFSGRQLPVPVLRQLVFLGEGQYRLRGHYRTAQLRTEQGFAWAIRCTNGPAARTTKSTALADTSNAWQVFDVVLDVPAACGPVVSLQLETSNPAEANTGVRGKLYLDELQIEPVSRPAHAANRISSTVSLTPPGR